MMNTPFRNIITAFVILLLSTFWAAPSFSADNKNTLKTEIKAENIVVDFILVRPIGIAGSVILTSVFILSLPFSLLGGNTGTVFNKLVSEPAKYTFLRPLGDFSE